MTNSESELSLYEAEWERRETLRDFSLWLSKHIPKYTWTWPHLQEIRKRLARVTDGSVDRLGIMLPPQHGKTSSVSIPYPVWRMMRTEGLRAGICSHSQRYANKISRWARKLATAAGAAIGEVSRADEWEMVNGSTFIARGRGASIAGEPLDLLIVDDVFGSRQDADSPVVQEEAYEWYMDDVTPRLQKDAAIVLVNCLAGDTPVTMGDGTRKRLEDVRPGDSVLAWEKDEPVVKRVLNWKDQGEDDVFEVNTGNHKVVGNARHPFLVDVPGSGLRWVPLSRLRTGDRIVCSGLETHAETAGRLTADQAWLLGFMFGDGWVTDRIRIKRRPNRNNCRERQTVTCCATSKHADLNSRVLGHFASVFNITPKLTKYGYWRTEVHRVGRWFLENGLVGGAKGKRVQPWLFSEPLVNREAFLRGFSEADGYHLEKYDRRSVAASNRGLIEDLRHLARSVGHRVTNIHEQRFVTQPPHSPAPVQGYTAKASWSEPAQTQEAFTMARVRSIAPVGRRVVYDIQVEGAESFIADGLVTHNTRWGPGDLYGRIEQSEEAREWDILRLPAIAEENDPLGRLPGEALCPDRFPLEKLLQKRRVEGVGFESLYQGNPIPRGGTFFERAWFAAVDSLPDGCTFQRYWDLACLVAGTRVETLSGSKPIESVRAGDYVLTRQGYKRVKRAWLTKYVDSVTTVRFSSGATLTGTPDHLVWTENRGWVELGSLTSSDYNTSIAQEGDTWQIAGVAPVSRIQSLSSSGESFTRADRGESITKRCGGTRFANGTTPIRCTGLFGDSTMARFQTATMFTTRMGITTTTSLATSRSFRGATTLVCMTASEASTLHRKQMPTVGASSRRRGRRQFTSPTSALTARSLLSRGGQSHLSSVLTTVAARSATTSGRIPVYDLEVEGAHEFFANGILVHNSSRNDSACFTSGVLMAKHGQGEASRYFVCDVIRGRWMPAERNDMMLRTAQIDSARPGFTRTWFEKPVFDKNGDASRAIVAKLAGYPVSPDNVSGSGSKELRAEPLAGAAKAGIVSVLAGSWVSAFLTELESFPRGQFKDQVDSSSGCFSKLSRPAGAASFSGRPVV